jgi:hypothetical protein
MVDPDVYYRGQQSTPQEQFDWYLREICDYLHQLWATEAVWDRFESIDAWVYKQQDENNAIVHQRDSAAQTLSSYPFNAPWMNDYTWLDEDLNITSENVAADEIATCFRWAPTIRPAEISAHCSLVLKPAVHVIAAEASTIASTCDSLYDYATALGKGDDEAMPSFVRSLQANGWSEGSLGSDSFYEFCGDLADKATHYSTGLYALATRTAAAGAAIDHYQRTVNGVALNARQELIAALKYWQAKKAPYSVTVTKESVDNLVGQVADGVQTVTDILGFVPVVGELTDVVGKVALIAEWGSKQFTYTVTSDRARSADAILADLVAAVGKAQDELLNAMDALRAEKVNGAGSFEQYVKDVDGNGTWKPKDVEF